MKKRYLYVGIVALIAMFVVLGRGSKTEAETIRYTVDNLGSMISPNIMMSSLS